MNRELTHKTELQAILVLEPDRLRGAVVARAVSRMFSSARVYCESQPATAARILAEEDIDLLIVAIRGFDLDILTLLGVWAEHGVGSTRVLVMTSDMESAALSALRSLPITGVYDSRTGNLEELEFACRAVASGNTYWHRCIAEGRSPRSVIYGAIDVPLVHPRRSDGRRAPPTRRDP